MAEANNKPFRPMRAADTPAEVAEFERHLPVYGSWKIDGIRGTHIADRIQSRSGKLIPSAYTKRFHHPEINGLDGELTAKVVAEGLTLYQASFSAVMTHGSMEPVNWQVFDCYLPGVQYPERLKYTAQLVEWLEHPDITLLEQRELVSLEEILAMEKEALEAGHEGLVLRKMYEGLYKEGKSTFNQGLLMKLARVLTSEAIIVGFEEQMENTNPIELNGVGYAKRSKKAEGMIPKNTLGAFWVRDAHDLFKDAFKIATGDGWDDAFKKRVWENRNEWMGKLLKYRYKPYGTVYKPRQPVGIGERSPDDLSE